MFTNQVPRLFRRFHSRIINSPSVVLRPSWGTALAVLFWGLFFPLNSFPKAIVNLQAPQSFIADPSHDQYFIANANGNPGERDHNGFISKLDSKGKVIDLHFIQGGKGTTVLHSPNGMVVVNETLYVADLDTVRGFKTTTGEPTITISLTRSQARELTGLTADQTGVLFVSDTEGNAIYRIDPNQDHRVSLLVHDEKLGGPHGLAVHPKTGRLVVTSLQNGTVLEVDHTGAITELVSNSFFTGRFRNLSGIDFDQYGTMYVSDLTAAKIWRIHPNHKMEVIAEFLNYPASVNVDRKNHLILVPYLYANGAEINGLERPANVGKHKKKRRTLSHYGMGAFEGTQAQ